MIPRGARDPYGFTGISQWEREQIEERQSMTVTFLSSKAYMDTRCDVNTIFDFILPNAKFLQQT
uniref:Uncharacterized protein n=1 Tax=Romanomermis culicivorax TaxID=13658 RepID=A0A915KZ06_ROMCU